MESIPHGNLCVALRTTTKTTTNKTKTTTNDCSGIMGKPSCSAVQLGRKDKPWTVWPEPLLSISTCFLNNLAKAEPSPGIASTEIFTATAVKSSFDTFIFVIVLTASG